jgi:hypothetical protein
MLKEIFGQRQPAILHFRRQMPFRTIFPKKIAAFFRQGVLNRLMFQLK